MSASVSKSTAAVASSSTSTFERRRRALARQTSWRCPRLTTNNEIQITFFCCHINFGNLFYILGITSAGTFILPPQLTFLWSALSLIQSANYKSQHLEHNLIIYPYRYTLYFWLHKHTCVVYMTDIIYLHERHREVHLWLLYVSFSYYHAGWNQSTC